MKLKKILCVITIGLLMAPAFYAVAAYAANTEDSPFSFSMTPSYTLPMYTSYRAKTNDTSVYVYPTAMSGVTKVGVSIKGKKEDGSTGDVTAASYYYTSIGQYRVDNYAYERGYSEVALGCRFMLGTNGATSGVWSPDCANQSSYPQMPH